MGARDIRQWGESRKYRRGEGHQSTVGTRGMSPLARVPVLLSYLCTLYTVTSPLGRASPAAAAGRCSATSVATAATAASSSSRRCTPALLPLL